MGKFLLIALLNVIIHGAAFADLAPIGEVPECGKLSISDHEEIRQMISQIPGAGRVETSDGVTTQTKEWRLGPKTVMTCSLMTENGKVRSYLRGRRSGCTIRQPEVEATAKKALDDVIAEGREQGNGGAGISNPSRGKWRNGEKVIRNPAPEGGSETKR